MDWIRNNKFMSGFLAVVAVGAGVLIYLLVTQMGAYDQVSQDYEAAVKEVQRLNGLEPYPAPAGERDLETLRKKTADSVTDLQTRLAAYEPPPEKADFKPIDFQDKLRRVVDEVSQAAAAARVELPKDFYMGFEQYRGAPPETAAAPALSRELDAVQDLLMILINKRITALTSIKRAPLPQESGAVSVAAPAPVAGRTAGAKPAATSPADSVSRVPVTVAFKCQPSSFRETLDELVTSKRLFLVRAVQVKNDAEAGPKKAAPALAEPTAPTPAPVPGAPDAAAATATEKPTLRYIVGLEGLTVTMRVEIVRVSPPAL